FVSYRVEASGHAYASKKPRGIFLGLNYMYTADFVAPGGKPLQTKLTFTQKIPIDTIRNEGIGQPAGTLESKVYEEMTRDAFAALRDKYLSSWFRSGKLQP